MISKGSIGSVYSFLVLYALYTNSSIVLVLLLWSHDIWHNASLMIDFSRTAGWALKSI